MRRPRRGRVVLLVGAQMLGELVDARGQQGDLDFGRAGVFGFAPVLIDDFGFALFRDRHWGPHHLRRYDVLPES